MMDKQDPHSNLMDEHTEAMLYLLEDPALDRAAFEARLADDPQLGEILAQAVSALYSLQAVHFDSAVASQASLVRNVSPVVAPDRQWQSISVIAASILLAGFLGWQTLFSIRSGSNELGLNNVVVAWGDLQSDALDIQARDVVDIDLENTLAVTDLSPESDVPEWLVMAATDTSEDYDSENGKALIQ
jgi:hypothetical protein